MKSYYENSCCLFIYGYRNSSILIRIPDSFNIESGPVIHELVANEISRKDKKKDKKF